MKNKKYKVILIAIMLLAFIVRLIYVVRMPFTERQHDLDIRYIYTIYETGHLPNSNEDQYYHPPLHQMICATVMKFESLFVKDIDPHNVDENKEFIFKAWESFQYITLIYSMILVRNYILYG